jgi:hypothetical protein
MWTYAQETLNGYGPFPMPRQEPWVVARKVRDVAVTTFGRFIGYNTDRTCGGLSR